MYVEEGMDSFMGFTDLFCGAEMTASIGSTVHIEEYPSFVSHLQAPHHPHLAEPDQTGPNKHVVGSGSVHAMNHELKNRGQKGQYQQSSTMEGAITAGMPNVQNLPPYVNPHQQAGNSQPSKDGNKADPKKLAKQLSDLKYREKKKQEMIGLKRKADELTERNELLEDENASLKKDVDRLGKALKQCEKDVCQLKDKHDGLTTTITEISKALAESKYVDVQRENEQLKLLINQINNPKTLDIIQCQAKIEQLEAEVSSRQLVIDALCKKMKTDN